MKHKVTMQPHTWAAEFRGIQTQKKKKPYIGQTISLKKVVIMF